MPRQFVRTLNHVGRQLGDVLMSGPQIMLDGVMATVDAIGSLDWETVNGDSFSGGAGVASYTKYGPTPGRIWVIPYLEVSHDDVTARILQVNIGIPITSGSFEVTVASASTAQSPAKLVASKLIIPPNGFIAFYAQALGGAYHLFTKFWYFDVPCGAVVAGAM